MMLIRLPHQLCADTHFNIDKIGETHFRPLLIERDIASVVGRQAAALSFGAQDKQQRFAREFPTHLVSQLRHFIDAGGEAELIDAQLHYLHHRVLRRLARSRGPHR